MACTRPADGQGADPDGDDALFARLLAAPQPHVARRKTPYRISKTVFIPPGKTVTLDSGTRIVWVGPPPNKAPVGVFEAAGDETGIVVTGNGLAFVECETPSTMVYAAMARGRRGFTVVGLQARECLHVCIMSSASDYTSVQTRGSGLNVSRTIRISRGGATYSTRQTTGQGACLLSYVTDCNVSDVHYENVCHGIQWWGGDAGLETWQNGARANERKCRDVVVERASVRGAHVGGIWGSMGQSITVCDCQVEDCGDVGFDAEGCVSARFERCTARNGHNGCFATFSLCDDIRFINCSAIVDRKTYPLFRVYNSSQSNADNRGIAIIGGRFECLDQTGPGTIDTAMGPVQDLAITGVELVNVRIDTAFFNMHRTRIANNVLTFPFPLPAVAAIRVGASKALISGKTALAGGVGIENNRIRYTAVGPRTASIAIQIREDDYNSNAAATVIGNRVFGPFSTGLSVINATANIGIVPTFDVSGNRFDGLARSARLLSIAREGEHARSPAVRWDDGQMRDGRAATLREATS